MVGVVGAPDARSEGERLIAFVVPRTGETVDETEISAHCASRLVSYKCPAEVRVVGQLPMTGAQKIDRVALRRTPIANSSPRGAGMMNEFQPVPREISVEGETQ
jgi:long-chain acyl-CoA synthetase